jgi:hypothetical protein
MGHSMSGSPGPALDDRAALVTSVLRELFLPDLKFSLIRYSGHLIATLALLGRDKP